jgi:hypothetical protein
MKNSNNTIGNRTRDLPACSAVPQPTSPWKSKCKGLPYHALQAQRWSLDMAQLIRNFGARWNGNLTQRPGHFTPGKEPRYPLYRRLRGPGAGLDGCEKSRPHRDSIPGPSSR